MRVILFSVFLFAVILISCDKPVEETQYQFPIIELNHCADTSINGQIVQICFDSVYDSRCPANVECMWLADASAKLSLRTAGVQQSFKLSTLNRPPYFRNDTVISGYKIKLLSILPYPGDKSNTPYRVELSIIR